jgi:hypothetical protein
MLHEFISAHREEIISRSWAKSDVPLSSSDVIAYSVFLDQLSDQLRTGLTTPARFEHRMDRREVTASHTIWQHYCDVREAITELALDMKAPVTVDEFYQLDRCVDDAISHAIGGPDHRTGDH